MILANKSMDSHEQKKKYFSINLNVQNVMRRKEREGLVANFGHTKAQNECHTILPEAAE